MWVVTNRGFFSVVSKDANGKPSGPEPEAQVSVRFRREQDARALFPNHAYVATPKGDYAGRVFASRREVALMLAQEVLGNSYDNFKDSIPKADPDLKAAASAAWTVFGRLQPGGPYGGRWYDDLAPYGGAKAKGTAYVEPKQGTLALLKDWADPKPAKQRNVVRHDPFCDGCGIRHGVKNLDADGLCKACAEHADAHGMADFEGEVIEAAQVYPEPVECWSCNTPTLAEEVNADGLCLACATAYADCSPELIADVRKALTD